MLYGGMNYYFSLYHIIVILNVYKEFNFESGFSEMFYKKLAVRRYHGKPLYTYLDKKCLRFGHDYEMQFLQGLCTAKVIILLMSNKVWLRFPLFLPLINV